MLEPVNVGLQSATLMLLALPMTLIIMSEGLDLSMGAVLGLAGVVLAMVLVRGASLATAVRRRSPSAAASASPTACSSSPSASRRSSRRSARSGWRRAWPSPPPAAEAWSGSARPCPRSTRAGGSALPFSVLVAAAAYLVFHAVLYHTRFGTYVFAIGGNRESLTLAGVRTNLYHVGIYALGGLMAGVGALLLTGRMNAGHPIASIGMEFDAIAAVVVGGTSFERGNGWLPGTLLGVLTIGVLKNGLNVLAVPSSLQSASIGLLVIVALLVDSIRGRA